MLYLILSIFFSVSVGILLKIAKKYPIDIIQVVTVNYAFAIALSYFSFSPDITVIDEKSPWEIYIPLAILLPSVFLILALSIKKRFNQEISLVKSLFLLYAYTFIFYDLQT